jgi:hypothetical protein
MSNSSLQSSPPAQFQFPSSPAPEAHAAFEVRWDAWVARGRQDDLAVQRRIRAVLLTAVVIAILAGLAFGVAAGLR